MRTCETCRKPFAPQHDDNRFCSKACYQTPPAAPRSNLIDCPSCGMQVSKYEKKGLIPCPGCGFQITIKGAR